MKFDIVMLMIRLIKTLLICAIVTFSFTACAQDKKQYQIRTVAFYNVENLFDTLNDPNTFDDHRTPNGRDNWTFELYEDKLQKIAKVLSEIGNKNSKTAPDIIGLCEVENRNVLTDLIKTEALSPYNYEIVHFDSPDERGIDVALLYKREAFTPISFSKHELVLYNEDGFRDYTRDQLLVTGALDGEEVHFIVNHWPSRSGGEAKSSPRRKAAAQITRKLVDSLQKENASAKIITMGDFNDDPTNASIKKVLKVEGEREKATGLALFNPMEEMASKGFGTLAYRDRWNLFDQIIISAEFLKPERDSYRFWKAGIYNKSYLIVQNGRYKGYPYRSYAGGNYLGGYSDHFPVFIHLIKEAQ